MKQPVKINFVEDDYFDLDTIIATNTSVICNFDNQTPEEFFPLMGQKNYELLSNKGFRMGISAWMVPAIDYNCSLTIPTAYNAINRDVIIAGAQVANFEQIQRHFYLFGIFACRLLGGDEGRKIASTLLTAFTQRIGWIVQLTVDSTAKPKFMDEMEKKIFRIGQKTECELQNWIQCADMYMIKRKRTRTSMAI